MALATLVKVSPMDTATGNRVDLYLSNVGDPLLGPKVNGLGGQVWVPAITNPPVLSIRTWNGDFTAAVEPGEARLGFSLGPVKRRWASVDSYHWAGAPIEVYAEEPGTAWPWTARFVGVVRDYGGTKRKLNLSASVDERRFAKNILTATYAGTGAIEGNESLKGKVKPLVIGWATNVEPVLIDAVNNIYQFSGYGPIEGVTALYERGSPFPASSGDYASYFLLAAATIPNGGWATCLASGLIRLGAPQFGVITGDVKGHKVGTTTPRLPGSVISALAGIAGVATADLNTTSLAALDTGVPYPINLFMDAQAEFDAAAKEIALTCNWTAGISLSGKFFAAPVSLTPSAALTLNAQGGSKPQVLDVNEKSVSLPYWKTIMGAQRSWRVHSADEIAFQEEGSSAINGYLTKESITLAAASDGTVSDYSLATGTFKVFQGQIDRTTETAFTLVSSINATASINPTTGLYSVTALSADTGSVTLQAVYENVTITKVLSLAKAKAGSNGNPGTPGLPAVSPYLTNEVIALFAYADGTVVSYGPASGTLKIYSGQTDVSSNFSLSTQANPQFLSVTYTGQNYSITGGFDANEDTATLTIRATGSGAYAGVVLDKVVTLSKVKGGYEIVSALPTSNLFEGRIVYLTTDNKIYRFDGTTWIVEVDGADIKAGSITAAKMNVTQLSAISGVIGLLRTATTGARLELESNQIRVYDGTNTLRVRIGVW